MSQNHSPSDSNDTNGLAGGTSAKLPLRARGVPANDTQRPARVARVGLFGLPRIYWMLWAGMLLNRLGGAVFFLLGIYLTRERDLSPELAGLVISLYAAGGLCAGPVGGALADKLGRRATLLTGTTCAGALMLALGFARSTSALFVLAPVLGFFTDACRPPLQAAVADVVAPEDRARAYGLLYWAMNLGFAGASVLGGSLAEHHFALLFVLDAVSTFAYGVIVFVGVPETRPALATNRGGDLARLLTPFRDRPFVKFVGIQVILLVAFAQVVVALPLDMRAHGLGLTSIGWLLGLNGIYIVIAQPILLRYVRGFDHVHWLAAGCVLTGMGLGATAFAGGALSYALTGVLWTLGEIGFSTASPALVADFAPAAQRGAYQGTYQLAWGIASMVAPTLGTFVLARHGAHALWFGCLGACVVAAGLHLRITGGTTGARRGSTSPR
ncbi:MAG: putative integral rane transport protein [Myxococcales bacterium]|nr:putative integral rane transport protein [Myxococcales bacterium]